MYSSNWLPLFLGGCSLQYPLKGYKFLHEILSYFIKHALKGCKARKNV